MAEKNNLYKRISLEFLNSFPGQVYLRFEPFSKVPAFMVQVLPADIVAISRLAEPYEYGPHKGERITAVEADEPGGA
jgi:hypothetical protein